MADVPKQIQLAIQRIADKHELLKIDVWSKQNRWVATFRKSQPGTKVLGYVRLKVELDWRDAPEDAI